jgi:hypothetical protein
MESKRRGEEERKQSHREGRRTRKCYLHSRTRIIDVSQLALGISVASLCCCHKVSDGHVVVFFYLGG